ncbi:hypothetical protein DAI22_07g018200 [Oryza sativa Japonica Group]|nr:hypothetical protein DAI22_07g018200 [Oryza sativa Japonica Group]
MGLGWGERGGSVDRIHRVGSRDGAHMAAAWSTRNRCTREPRGGSGDRETLTGLCGAGQVDVASTWTATLARAREEAGRPIRRLAAANLEGRRALEASGGQGELVQRCGSWRGGATAGWVARRGRGRRGGRPRRRAGKVRGGSGMVAEPGIKERREADGGTQLRTAAAKKAGGEGARGRGGGHGSAARKRVGRPAAETEQQRRPSSIISRVNEHAQRIYAVYRGEGERSSPGRKERAGGRDVLGGFDAEAGRMALSARGRTVAATGAARRQDGAAGEEERGARMGRSAPRSVSASRACRQKERRQRRAARRQRWRGSGGE